MMQSCAALIFDVDGTLADTEELHRQAFNEAFTECRLGWSWDASLYGELLEVAGGKERIASYIESLRVQATERRCLLALVPEIHRIKTRVYGELLSNGRVPLRSGIRRLLIEARRAGVGIAIASTTSPENIEALVTSSLGTEAIGWFDAIAAGDVVGRKKPAPDIYNVALQALNLAPTVAIAFEDSAIGVTAAKGAGLFTVATPSFWTRGQDFEAADLVLGSLGDPHEPLAPADQARLGAPYLSLDRLAALQAAANAGVTHVEAD
jgi:HAD superfamily hydrolase (TIGR01509 family)